MAYSNGYNFTTLDRLNNPETSNCATNWFTAWWHGPYSTSFNSQLNGRYNATASKQGVHWAPWTGLPYPSMRFSEIKIRPLDYMPPVGRQ